MQFKVLVLMGSTFFILVSESYINIFEDTNFSSTNFFFDAKLSENQFFNLLNHFYLCVEK